MIGDGCKLLPPGKAAENANGQCACGPGGMQIVQPSAQLKADMKKVGETMLAEWLAKAGDEGKALVDAFKKP